MRTQRNYGIDLLRQAVFRVLHLNQFIKWIQARCDAAGGRLVRRICGEISSL